MAGTIIRRWIGTSGSYYKYMSREVLADDLQLVPAVPPLAIEPPAENTEKPSAALPDGRKLGLSETTQKDVEATLSTSQDYIDGGYGWICVACSFFTAAVTWGVNGVFGVYLSFYLEYNYFPGATPLDYAFVGGLSLSMAMFIGPVSNYMSKRYGYRASYITGAVLLVAGQLMAGFATELWELFMTQGVLFGLGLGFIMVSTTPILATWFGKKRALAVGIAGGGSGFGGLVLSQITRAMIENHSLKLAFITNASICAGVLVPCILLMKRPPNQKAQHNINFEPYKPSLLRNYGFLSLIGFGVFLQLGYSVGLYSIPTYATQALGYSQSRASVLQTLFNAGQLVMRPLCGVLLDRYGRINMASVISIFCGMTCFVIWNFSTSFTPLAIFAILQGGTSGVFWISCQVLIVELTSMPDLTAGLSMLWLSIVPSISTSEAIAVALVNYSRNTLGRTGVEAFRITINFAGTMFVASGLCLLFAKRKKQGTWQIFRKV